MFQFTGFPPYCYVFAARYTRSARIGFPIQISADHGLFAAPHSFSQLTASFIGSHCQGIRPALFVYLTKMNPFRIHLRVPSELESRKCCFPRSFALQNSALFSLKVHLWISDQNLGTFSFVFFLIHASSHLLLRENSIFLVSPVQKDKFIFLTSSLHSVDSIPSF